METVVAFLAIIGALTVAKIIYEVLLEWWRNEKTGPWLNRLDRDTLDQIKLEKEGYHVGWVDGNPVVLPKEDGSKKKQT